MKLPDLKGMKVLITGGLGFIGSNLAVKCLELGAEVTIYDNHIASSGANLFNIENIRNSVEFIIGDILDTNQLSQHILDKDLLFNCAATTSHPFSMQEPMVDLDINGRGVISVMEACRCYNSKIKVIHLGTTTQLGKLHYSPADENHPEFPTDIYSANKSVSEKYCLIYANAYNIPLTVLRLSNVYGPRARIDNPNFNFVNFFIGLGLMNRPISVFGEGMQLRNLLYIDDCVSAIILASRSSEVNNQVLFATGEEHISVAEIAKTIGDIIGGEAKFIKWPENRKTIEIGDAIISNTKIKENLNWEPEINFKTGLKKTKDFYSLYMESYIK